MKKLLSLGFILFSLQSYSFSQNQQLVDSLEAALKNHNAKKLELNTQPPSLYDTTAANILYYLSATYWYSNPEKAQNYAEQCLALSEQIGYKKGIAAAINSMGSILTGKGDYLPALEYFEKALKIGLEINDKKSIASAYNNMGSIYGQQGNYPEALKVFFAALKIKEEIGDKRGIANAYGNIGLVYATQGNNAEALKNIFISLNMKNEMGEKRGAINAYLNIANVYIDEGNYPEALNNSIAALKISEETGDKSGISDAYNKTGIINYYQGNYPEALNNYFIALKKREELGNKNGVAETIINIGQVYRKQKNNNKAYAYLNKGLSLSKDLGSLEFIESCYENLSAVDSAQGNFDKAFEHYKLFITYRDSLSNNENTKKLVTLQMNYEFDKKQDSLSIVQAKRDMAMQIALNKQILVRNRFVGGTILFLLLAGAAILFYINRMQHNRKKQMEAVRARISRDLHDDMGSTLQSISVMSEIARIKSTSDSSQASIPFLEKIGSASREMVDKMNDIVWAVNPQNDDFENIILHMRAFGGELLAGKDIALHFKSDSGLNSIRLSMEKRKSFFLVYKEALNNAYKYSGAKNVNVEISKTHHSLKLVVEDDGVGFSMHEDRLKTGGNGLKNMNTRAAELNGSISITSAPGQGTKVCLTVNLSY
jgi:two-component system sensor histidine kinase UhpB